MKESRKKVFVAMSGGVDSSVAALLLKNQGYDVVGVFMRCFNLDGCQERDAEDARRVAGHLGIPFYAWDFEEEYKQRVVEYMVEGYRKGITPNPDVMCNKEIKFGLFLKRALEAGADFVATGHYVRLTAGEEIFSPQPVPAREIDSLPTKKYRPRRIRSRAPDPFSARSAISTSPLAYGFGENTLHLYQAKDLNKDQSYFLWTLTQEQLKHCLFPIGDYLKSEVRDLARKAGLPTAEKKDSQGICFLGKVTLGDFLKTYIPEKRGAVLSTTGEKVGEHDGAEFYTIGQRHIGVANGKWQMAKSKEQMARSTDPRPFYVAEKYVKSNTLVVAEGDENPALYRREISLRDVNFINASYSNVLKNIRIRVLARVRYRQPLSRAVLLLSNSRELESSEGSPSTSSGFRLVFDNPQKFIAPGQSAVFYVPADLSAKALASAEASAKAGAEEMEMLGGGVIA